MCGKTLAQIWFGFFDPRVVVIATVDPGPVCLPLTLNHLFLPRNYCLVVYPLKNYADSDEQVQTGANVEKRREPRMSVTADLHSEITECLRTFLNCCI